MNFPNQARQKAINDEKAVVYQNDTHRKMSFHRQCNLLKFKGDRDELWRTWDKKSSLMQHIAEMSEPDDAEQYHGMDAKNRNKDQETSEKQH
jgi:hypothetical protein